MGSSLSTRQSGFSAADMRRDLTAGWSWSRELLFHCAISGGWTMYFCGSWWWTWVLGEAGVGLWVRPSGFSGRHGW